MYIDCRRVNKITIKYQHLILRLNDILEELYNAYIFTKIDLKSAYYQIKIKPNDE